MNGSFWNPDDQILMWALNVVLQVGLVAALATLIGMALRRSSAARYWLLCSALLVVLACPVLTAVVQSSGLSLISVEMIGATPRIDEVPPKEVLIAPSVDELRQNQTSDVSVVPPMTLTEVNAAAFERHDDEVTDAIGESVSPAPGRSVSAPASAATIPQSPTMLGQVLRTVGPPLVVIWAIVAVALLMRLFIQWHRLSLLLRSARLNTDEAFANTFQAACTALGIHSGRLPALVLSSDVSGPIAAGIRSPKVVFPTAFVRQINSEQLRDILIHEVAHIVRGDQLVVLLQNLVGALFWMHPLVLLLNRQLAKAREEVCDNYVLAATDAPSYSRTLLTLAQLLNSPRQIPGAVGLFTSRWKLEHRVAGLLDARRNRVTRLSKAAFALIGVLSLLFAMTAAIATMSLANASPNDEVKTAAQQKPDEVVASVPVASDDVVVVRGIVLKPDGSPAAGATVRSAAIVYVSLQKQLPVGFKPETTTVKTDQNGRFEIVVHKYPFGDIDLRGTSLEKIWMETPIVASLDGFGGDGIRFRDIKQLENVVLNLVEDLPLRGRVVDLEGQPIAGVPVTIGGLARTLTGELSDWLKAIEAGEDVQSFSRHLSHSDDPALFGVPGNVNTDANGEFVVNGIGRERIVTLQFVGDNVAFQEAKAVTREMQPAKLMVSRNLDGVSEQVFGANFVFSASPSQPVEGVVVDAETKQPLSGVAVEATRFAGSNLVGRKEIKTVTDANGRFRLVGVPKAQPHAKENRQYNYIMLRPNDDQPYLMRDVQVPVGEGLDLITMTAELHRGIWIKGRVTNKVTGAPVPAVRMYYLAYRTNQFALATPEFDENGNVDGDQTRYETDKNGEYRLVGLPGPAVVGAESMFLPFRYGVGFDALNLPKEGDAARDTFFRNPISPSPKWPNVVLPIDPSKETEEMTLNFQLDPGASVEIHVVDESGKFVVGAELEGLASRHGGAEITEAKPYVATSLALGEDRVISVHHKEKGLGQMARINDERISSGKMEIRLQACATVTGRLTDEGKPMTGISIRPRILPFVDFSKSLPDFTTNQQGVFTGTLLPGCQYGLFAEGVALGYVSVALGDNFTVEPGQKIDLETWHLTKDRKFIKAIAQAGDQVVEPVNARKIRSQWAGGKVSAVDQFGNRYDVRISIGEDDGIVVGLRTNVYIGPGLTMPKPGHFPENYVASGQVVETHPDDATCNIGPTLGSKANGVPHVGDDVMVRMKGTPATFIVAKHVVLHDGKIIRWDEVRDRLEELNERGLVEPEIRFTPSMQAIQENGGQQSIEFGKWCEETTGGGFNWSFANESYDSITSDEDLRPTAERKIGTVMADGLPVADAEIIVYTSDDGRNHEVYIEHGRLRRASDEQGLTHSAPNGRFAIYPQTDRFQLLVLHEKGMALVNSDQWSNQADIELQPWASITGKFDGPIEFDETAQFETKFVTPGWAIIAIEVWDTPLFADRRFQNRHIPPGKISVTRAVKSPRGGATGIHHSSFELAPGDAHQISIGAFTKEGRRRAEEYLESEKR